MILRLLNGLAILLVLAGILLLVLGTCLLGTSVLAQDATPIALSDVQQLRARVLQLDSENENLRRTILGLQIQIAQLKQPTDQAAREKAWTALEQTLGNGCKVDRGTLAVTCAPLPATPLPKPSSGR